MKTDYYTKTILTIIAICLTLNVAQDFEIIPSVHATNDPSLTPSTLASISETIDVRIVDINTSDELNINLKSIDTYDELKVNINSIETTDELDVNIDEIGGGWVNNGGPIKVKMD
jgi:hypothetical protein